MSATFAMHPVLHRQPLAPVRRTRVRALQQTKLSSLNKLNVSLPSTPLKRTISYDSDAENVLPAMKADASKRKRAADDDGQLSESPKALKASRISLVTIEKKAPDTTTPRKVNMPMAKPAGRSPPPKAKLSKAFGRRSQRNSLKSNSVPNESFMTKPEAPSRKVTQPASWFFHIHTDTPEEEATNTMQHFAGRLDISDDEGKANSDDRGKENIPPHELGLTLPTATQPVSLASRKNMVAQSRAPLGELKGSDYYGPGLHGLSYAVIYEDENPKALPERSNTSGEPEPLVIPRLLPATSRVSEEVKAVDEAIAA